ncbi:glycoside hydrolase family 32 protein [Adhaeribacter rhizoryzae]|uniref:Glycoside hydrolase family 32 protein n=1 Tax=Adhaeribacter rhizoryzae TaxID=2607907 RepID=A0A5M6D7Y1_9BACT|nr:glycoside hydrolase family 32 protein [Adhaeribacter rhizoryzae]KAA5541285.1 glycoside hydrolase family 32 protein [Adhaeribacter rhizoryzae]
MKKITLGIALCGLLYSCSSKQTSSEGNNTTTTDKNQAEAGKATAATFDELHRPQFHFTPPAGWMNDPNGMVYHNGEYHLFYQHNPDSTVWGPMHWGHAVSKDLVSWEHLPIALYPDSLGTIFSGSAVIDKNNTSDLGTKDNPAMVAIYTYHNAEGEKAGRNDYQTQGVAYSLDNGRTWTKYKANPVLKNPGIKDFRDPKVSWYDKGQKWIMTLAVKDHISFYSSKNLLNWTKESDFGADIGGHGGVWECPDLFTLPIAGTNEEKWILIVNINPGAPNGGSGTQYFVGEFDGKNFVLDNNFKAQLTGQSTTPGTVKKGEGIWLDYGKDNYAGITWANVPETDGRRLFIGWMSNWQYANEVPTQNWRSATTVARTLTLENTPAGLRVASQPVKELQNIYATTHKLTAQTVTDALNISEKLSLNTPTFETNLELELAGGVGGFAVELANSKNQRILIGYDAAGNRYYIDRTQSGPSSFSKDFAGIHYAPRIATGSKFLVKLLVDVASVELFADNGKTVMTEIFFPDEKFTRLRLIPNKGQVKLNAGTVTELKSIWNKAE